MLLYQRLTHVFALKEITAADASKGSKIKLRTVQNYLNGSTPFPPANFFIWLFGAHEDVNSRWIFLGLGQPLLSDEGLQQVAHENLERIRLLAKLGEATMELEERKAELVRVLELQDKMIQLLEEMLPADKIQELKKVF